MASGSDSFNSGLFVEEIQKCECLYNKLCKDYKNKFIRLNCWKKIGEKFQVTPDEAEKKYKYIRTSYGRWLKKRKSVPSGSGRDAIPKVPPEFENLDWLSNHINHKHVAISNLPTQEVSDIEESADLAVDTLDEGQDLQSEVQETESPDSGSVSERLPSSTRSSSSNVRMQIEQLMFQVQFGGKVSNSSLPEQNVYLSQGPYSNPSHCNRQGLLFGNSLDSYHLQNLS